MEVVRILHSMAGFAVTASIYAIFALGLNVHWGYTGLFNIGIAGFFAIGAYTSALVTSPQPTGVLAHYVKQAFGLNMPFLVGVTAAGLVSGLLAIPIGIPTLRLREDYLAIATIGIAETIRLIFNNERWLANGPQGMIGLAKPLGWLVPPNRYNFIYLAIVLAFLLIIYLALERGIRSPWGRVLRAVREDEVVTSAAGKNVFLFKMQSLVLGAVIMGIGGALYAHAIRAIQPGVFTPLFGTLIIWVMLILGGSGNNKGVILGAFIIWGIWSGTALLIDHIVPVTWSARAPYLRFLLIGLLLIGILLTRPQGLLGEEKQVSRMM
ncbi:MAG: branched-chain amino acid ABC transporter permease [Chloroflexota bacterium]|nr:branched-chain amino acid ABC transporter permease [Chloroflexota bacterium]